MARQLILHVGMNKTGSTAIQAALKRTRAGPGWQAAVGETANLSHLIGAACRARDPDARAALSSVLDRFDAPRAILSAEDLWSASPDVLTDLLELAAPHAASVRAVAYIRAPLSYLQASFQQRLRRRFVPLSDLNSKGRLDYPGRCARLETALGKDALSLRAYRPERFTKGSVVADLAEWQGLDTLRSGRSRVNESLGDQAVRLMFLWRCRHRSPGPGDATVIQSLRGLKSSRPFRLGQAPLDPIAAQLPPLQDWARHRLGWDMHETPARGDGAIESEADFAVLDPDTIDWLARRTGHRASALRHDTDAVAAAVERLRHTGGPARRLLRWSRERRR